MVPVGSDERRKELEAMAPLILSEVNVKELKLVGDDEGVLVKSIKPDFKKLGPKFGKDMKKVAAAISALTQQQINSLEREGVIALSLDGTEAKVDAADVEIISEDIPGWLVANEGNLTVALDITLTPELRAEGMARELVNRIQNIRKSRDYSITDRINVIIEPSELTENALGSFSEYIATQVLADSIVSEPLSDVGEDEILDIDGDIVKVKVTLA